MPLVADADSDGDGDWPDERRGIRETGFGGRIARIPMQSGVGDADDNCAGRWNMNQFDANGNGVGDVCDAAERAENAAGFGDLDASGADDVAVLKIDGGIPTVYVKASETD
ncbi:MAG: hypothetical protein U5K38_05640 [Woeseiaceae bacterium]|nr:hypothetical protein [Woeseiaceae bacterium]